MTLSAPLRAVIPSARPCFLAPALPWAPACSTPGFAHSHQILGPRSPLVFQHAMPQGFVEFLGRALRRVLFLEPFQVFGRELGAGGGPLNISNPSQLAGRWQWAARQELLTTISLMTQPIPLAGIQPGKGIISARWILMKRLVSHELCEYTVPSDPLSSERLRLRLPNRQSRHDGKVRIIGGQIRQGQGLHGGGSERIIGEQTMHGRETLSDPKEGYGDGLYRYIKPGDLLRGDFVMSQLLYESRMLF
jgi:hypothetical protein